MRVWLGLVMWSANPVANAESGPETPTRDRSIDMKASLQLARGRLYAVGSIGLCRLQSSDRHRPGCTCLVSLIWIKEVA
jgi:hypothetical protein